MATGKARAKQETLFGNAHHLLAGALEVTPPTIHPRRPFHGGGPSPKVDAQRYVVAALWLCDQVEPLVDASDRGVFEEWRDLAREQLRLGEDDRTHVAKLRTAVAGKVRRPTVKVAVWAAHEANNWATRPIYAGGAARPAAKLVASLLLDREGPDRAQRYLLDLDAECLRLDALTLAHERKLSFSRPLARTVWRGVVDDKPMAWLSQLDPSGRGGRKKLTDPNDGWALLVKLKTRWTVLEGTRDEVLASVPDSHFAAAVAAASA